MTSTTITEHEITQLHDYRVSVTVRTWDGEIVDDEVTLRAPSVVRAISQAADRFRDLPGTTIVGIDVLAQLD
jgi:hypothetical protein